jgi:hypothetical protein
MVNNKNNLDMYIEMCISASVIFYTNSSLYLCCDQLVAESNKDDNFWFIFICEMVKYFPIT